jgi:diguanylate cyclase (GGDEF)-like protein
MDDAGLLARLAQAETALMQGDYVSCEAMALALYDTAVAAGNTLVAAEAALVLAKQFSNREMASHAGHWADVAQAAAASCGAPHVEAVAWVVLAVAKGRSEDALSAVQAIGKALALMTPATPVSVQIPVFTGIGLSYYSMAMPFQSLAAMRRVVSLVGEGSSPARRLRARENLLYSAVAAYELLADLDPAAALHEVQAVLGEVELMQAELALLGGKRASVPYLQSLGKLYLCLGQLAQSRELLQELVDLNMPVDPLAQVEALVDLGRVERKMGLLVESRSRALQAQEVWALLPPNSPVRFQLKLASELAELLDDPAQALACFKRYHAKVVRNQHAAFEARVAELTATVAAQSMQLEITDLQSRNAGLSETAKSLQDLALTDALTSVTNRRGLEQRFGALRASKQSVVLVMIDLDHFKQVNDRFSHGVGDQVLRQAAQLMAAALRDRDHLARYGGEEFTALLVGTSLPEAATAAERLRNSVQAFEWPALAAGLQVTVSAGMVAVGDGEPFEAAVARADRLLYQAKRAGRNRVFQEPGGSAFV